VRADTVCMMRIRNEERWLGRSLERTWQVCQRVVIFDDHSTDQSRVVAIETMGQCHGSVDPTTAHQVFHSADGTRVLHWLKSPFADSVDEVRDKNFLWEYVCGLPFRHVLCLDGDEALSLRAIRGFPAALNTLVSGGASVGVLPFVYLWNEETLRRVDGVYRDIRHARLFTIDRALEYRAARFVSHGLSGFHCGSVPHQLNIGHRDMPELEIIHWGYLDEAIRQRKLEFYNTLDPGNEGEGYYQHVVGLPNHLAPGPVKLVPWSDA
jgi:hypothetical protein